MASDLAAIEAAVDQLHALVDADDVGCGFCPAEMSAYPIGWSARVLAEPVTWTATGTGSTATVEAGTYPVCPRCEGWIAARQGGAYADSVLNLAGVSAAGRAAMRSELTAMFLAVAGRIGPPSDLIEYVESGGRF